MRSSIFRFFLAASLVATAAAQQAGPGRLSFSNSIRAVSDLPAGEQPGLRPAIVRRALRSEELSASVDIEVALRMRNFAELQARIARGEVISPSEMEARYWPAAVDHDRLVAWFNSQGIAVVRTDANRLAVFGRTSVARAQQSFQVTFARVASHGAEFTSAVTPPSLPADIAGAVVGVHGLQPHVRLRPIFHLNPRAGSSNAPPYLPAQIATAYGASGLGLTGSGQTIAIVENAYPSTSDLAAFWTAASLGTTPVVQQVSVDGGPASPADSSSQQEASLDVEWCGGLAPGATLRVYGSNVSDSAGFDKTYQQIYADAQPGSGVQGLHQFSVSFGENESLLDKDYLLIESQYMANLASAGIAVFVASGDGGSNPDPVNNYYNPGEPLDVGSPTSDPDVTGVGGTTLSLASNGAIAFETAWSVSGSGSDGTGGGASAYFARPAWQTGAGVPSGSFRLTPDVAAAADPNAGAVVIISGVRNTVGGTSWATPTWAAFCALMNQSRASSGLPALGFLNPRLYPLIGTPAFRDIIVGSNGAYSAGVGYDLCTGIGTPNIAALLQASFSTSGTAPVIYAQLGSQAVTLAQIATFAVSAEGSAPLTYQWQRLPWGAQTWVNLADNSTYSGSATADLLVMGATYAMDGDEFRCIVGNAAGSVTGAAVALSVDSVGVTTLAGWPDAYGATDGTGRLARFNSPGSVRTDPAGNLYVADSGNNTIRKITQQGIVTTVAGIAGVAGSTNGPSGTALLNGPGGVAVDSAGNLYVADNGNYEIREISASGTVTTLAGSAGVRGTTDGTGSGALFYDPQNLALDGNGNLYVVDGKADTLRKVVLATGAVTTLAGSPVRSGTSDGAQGSARFNDPLGVGTDSYGNIYVADTGNDTVRKVTPAGAVTTLAGLARSAGSSDGTGSGARFSSPSGIAVDPAGDIFVADTDNDTIREISPSLVVTTIAGAAGQAENIDGLAANARFDTPGDLALDSAGNLYVADTGNNTVRRIAQGTLPVPSGTVAIPAPSSPQAAGSAVTMSVNVPASASAILQWQLNGVSIAGATGSILSIPIAGAADAGAYTVVATNAAGATTLSVGTLQVTINSYLYNMSTTGYVGSGAYQDLDAGFYIQGSGFKNVVVRGVGPYLAVLHPNSFTGLTLASPKLTFNNASGPLATNTTWGGTQILINAFNTVFAPVFPTNSNDTAIFMSVPGSGSVGYTADVTSATTGGAGVAQVEVDDYDSFYDYINNPAATPASHLTNISTRGYVGASGGLGGASGGSQYQYLDAGFYIFGSTFQTLLIRAIGPGEAASFPGQNLTRPMLTLYDSSGNVIATNAGWGNTPVPGNSTVAAEIQPATTAIMNSVYASTIAPGSADCAMVVTLPTGTGYTAEVSSADHASAGIALVEVYNIP